MSKTYIIKDYPCNIGNYSEVSSRPIDYIVIHYVGATGNAIGNAKYFMSHSGLGASAHFFVGHASEDGAIYQGVDPANRAWHCGSESGKYTHPTCRNSNSIGIEMCCHQDSSGKWYFDDVTIEQTIELTKYLMEQYGIPASDVLRHYDVTGKNCPAPFVEDESAWQDFKNRLEVSEMAEVKTGDNPSDWAGTHTEWAKEKGIINGDGQGNYNWQGELTREGMAAILHNFANAYGLEKE